MYKKSGNSWNTSPLSTYKTQSGKSEINQESLRQGIDIMKMSRGMPVFLYNDHRLQSKFDGFIIEIYGLKL